MSNAIDNVLDILDEIYITEYGNGECLECGAEIEEGMVYCETCEDYLDKQGFFET